MTPKTVGSQLKSNVVAIISLIVAITALGYNTWRNEHSEKNRNIRVAAFELLKELGELQIVVNNAVYVKSKNENPLDGWEQIAMIGDLAELIPPPVPQTAKHLIEVWKEERPKVKSDETSADKISHEIDVTRQVVLKVLYGLR
jgi:hypothetical protein